MNIDPSYYVTSTSLFAAFAAIALLAMLGALWGRRKQQPWAFFKSTLLSVLLGQTVVLLALAGSYFGLRSLGFALGEPMQSLMAYALMLGGFVSGVLMAIRSLRVGFIEILVVVALSALVPLCGATWVSTLFTYGTSAAYYAAVFLAADLLLLLALLLGGVIGYLLFGDGALSVSFGVENWIGRRFLMAKRSSQAISIITLISVVAVMVGCGGMIVVMSVMNGFSSDLRSKILGANAHILVLKYGNDFNNYDRILQKSAPLTEVAGASPFVMNEVMVSSEINLSGAVIKGIDVATIGSVSDLPQNMEDGQLSYLDHPDQIPTNPEHSSGQSESDALSKAIAKASGDDAAKPPALLPGIIVGREMARSLKIFVGDVVNVVSPIGELGPSGPVPKSRAFRVAGIFYSGMYEYDSKFVYIALSEAQSFFTMKDAVTGIEYKLKNTDKTQEVGRQLRQLLGGYPYYTKDWMQMNRNLFSALKLEKIAMFIILMALIFMASLLILVALIMVVIEKGKEIAILKSMGATDASIMKIFVSYGLIIGGFGAGLGLLLGMGLCGLIGYFGIGLDPEIYYITHIPILMDPNEVMLVGLGALIVSFFATIPPALFAARLKPVEGLRYE